MPASKIWALPRGRRGKIAIIAVLATGLLLEQTIFAIGDTASVKVKDQPRPKTFAGKLNLAVANALGSSDRGVRRFRVVSVRRASGAGQGLAITVRWAINNDISAGTVGNDAQADAYLLFGHVFSMRASIARVNLIGTYPISGRRETTVMRLWMDRKTAETVAGYGWGTIDAATLWPLIHRVYVASDFEPVPAQ